MNLLILKNSGIKQSSPAALFDLNLEMAEIISSFYGGAVEQSKDEVFSSISGTVILDGN